MSTRPMAAGAVGAAGVVFSDTAPTWSLILTLKSNPILNPNPAMSGSYRLLKIPVTQMATLKCRCGDVLIR